MFHNYYSTPTWYIFPESGLTGYIPRGNISSPNEPEVFDGEEAYIERCIELDIEPDSGDIA